MTSAVGPCSRPGRSPLVGASPRPGTFGHRLVTEAAAHLGPDMHLVNPRYDEVVGRPCAPSLAALDAPVDLVLLGVPDAALERAAQAAAGDGAALGASIFGAAHGASLASPARPIATDAGMAVCGGGCMGFVNLATACARWATWSPIPCRPGRWRWSRTRVRRSRRCCARRGFGYPLAVSSGQELVTDAADYLDYTLADDGTRSSRCCSRHHGR